MTVICVLKIPCDSGVFVDYSHLCDLPDDASSGIPRQDSHSDLSALAEEDDSLKDDLLHYPCDPKDLSERYYLYDMEISGFHCRLRRGPSSHWVGLILTGGKDLGDQFKREERCADIGLQNKKFPSTFLSPIIPVYFKYQFNYSSAIEELRRFANQLSH